MGKLCMNCGEIEHRDATQCRYCKSTNIEEVYSTMTIGEHSIIRSFSKNPAFIKAMMELHETDIIEYEMKLSQIKEALESRKQALQSNMLKCPYCGSTNVKKITTTSKIGSAAVWGIFAVGKIAKNYHCKNCKSDF